MTPVTGREAGGTGGRKLLLGTRRGWAAPVAATAHALPDLRSSGPREGVTWWRSQPGSRSREHTNAHEWPSVTWLLVARTLQPVPPRPGCPWLHGVGGRLWKVWSPPPTSGPEPPPSARLHHSLSPLLLQSRLSATNGDTRCVAGSCTGDTSQYRCHMSPGPRCLGRGSERAHRAPAPPHPWLGSPPTPVSCRTAEGMLQGQPTHPTRPLRGEARRSPGPCRRRAPSG